MGSGSAPHTVRRPRTCASPSAAQCSCRSRSRARDGAGAGLPGGSGGGAGGGGTGARGGGGAMGTSSSTQPCGGTPRAARGRRSPARGRGREPRAPAGAVQLRGQRAPAVRAAGGPLPAPRGTNGRRAGGGCGRGDPGRCSTPVLQAVGTPRPPLQARGVCGPGPEAWESLDRPDPAPGCTASTPAWSRGPLPVRRPQPRPGSDAAPGVAVVSAAPELPPCCSLWQGSQGCPHASGCRCLGPLPSQPPLSPRPPSPRHEQAQSDVVPYCLFWKLQGAGGGQTDIRGSGGGINLATKMNRFFPSVTGESARVRGLRLPQLEVPPCGGEAIWVQGTHPNPPPGMPATCTHRRIHAHAPGPGAAAVWSLGWVCPPQIACRQPEASWDQAQQPRFGSAGGGELQPP